MAEFIKEWTVIDAATYRTIAEKYMIISAFSHPVLAFTFRFRFIDAFTAEGMNLEMRTWGNDVFLWGTTPHTICLFNETTPGARVTNVSPLGGAAKDRVTVRITKTDTPIEITARVLHEMLHVMGIDSDQMDGKDYEDFKRYVREMSPNRDILCKYFTNPAVIRMKWGTLGQSLLLTYYIYLLYKHIPECCRHVPEQLMLGMVGVL